MLLTDLLRRSAETHPHKSAIVFPDSTISFRELDVVSDRVAASLQNVGVRAGDRVGILWENSIQAIVYFWGVLKAGAQVVDIPSLSGAAAMELVLEEAQPKALAVQTKHLETMLREQRGRVLPKILLGLEEMRPHAEKAGAELLPYERSVEETAPLDPPAVNEHDVAINIYTSGTTGRPKGVMLSHDNLHSNVRDGNRLVGLTDHDSILMVVPFYFIHGRMQIAYHVMISGTVVVSAGFQFPTQLLKEIINHKVTGFSGVPYHFITLMEKTPLKDTALPDLKYVLITGGALSPAQLEKLHAAMPTVDIHTAYGQTEASPRITWLGPKDMFGAKKGSAGIALPNVKVEIVDDNGDALPRGQVGEVVAGGPGIMRGYVSGDHVSSGRIDNKGRLRTGDLGRFDDDNYLWLVGRSSDMIKSAGERIFPKEIEDVVNAHPAVAESAVIGVKDETLGEKIVALVVMRDGQSLTISDLRKHCTKTLPFVRTPRDLRVVPSLPKTGTGKIDRGAVKKLGAES